MQTTPQFACGRWQPNLSQNSNGTPDMIANKTRKCYQIHMPLRICRVSCRDSRGVEHRVEVTAQSLYEAVAQALRVFRENDWAQATDRDPDAVIVSVKQPEIEHRVLIRDFESWLNSVGKGPAEMTLKSRLRTILDR
jgi:hypothetical protein